MRTDARGGSVRENPMRVMGLGAPHGLNGLFLIFGRRYAEGGGLSLPTAYSPGARKRKSPIELRAVRASAPKPIPRKGFRRTDTPCASERRPCAPEPAPTRPPPAPRTRSPGPHSTRLWCDRPGPITAPLAPPDAGPRETGPPRTLIYSTFNGQPMNSLMSHPKCPPPRALNRPLPLFTFTQEDRNA